MNPKLAVKVKIKRYYNLNEKYYETMNDYIKKGTCCKLNNKTSPTVIIFH